MNKSAEERAVCAKERTEAAAKLSENLESIDLYDLIESACMLYNKLTIPGFPTEQSEYRLGVCPEARSYDEFGRRIADRLKTSRLNGFYNLASLRKPDVYPETVTDLLLKVQWLSVLQLPEFAHLDANSYLKWKVLFKWMEHVAKRNQFLRFDNSTKVSLAQSMMLIADQ